MRRHTIKIGIMLCALFTCMAFLDIPPAPRAKAASASCTIGPLEATIVVDSTIQTATISPQVLHGGYIVNGGSNSIFVNFLGNGVIAGTNAQNLTGEIEIPANGTVPVRTACKAFSYQSATSTSLIYWFPGD